MQKHLRKQAISYTLSPEVADEILSRAIDADISSSLWLNLHLIKTLDITLAPRKPRKAKDTSS